MIRQYHRDLRRRIERLEEHFFAEPEPAIYFCWKNDSGKVASLGGPGLRWSARDHPGGEPPPIPAPRHLPPPRVVTFRTGNP